jgi:nucleoside-diphosphate-sugar epimerase
MKEISILLTGGAGFLGKAIVDELLADDCPLKVKKLRVLDIREKLDLEDPRLEYVRGTVTDLDKVTAACKGMDLVIHSAAIVDWGTHTDKEIMDVNYGGTENVIKACRTSGVTRLIYTSSLDAVYGGKPLVDIDETIEYPEKHETIYCRSKYLSELKVFEEHGKELECVVLRPSDIYGEGDPYHIGSLINMAKGGFYVRLGNGEARCQHVYVRNMAWAHILVAKALMEDDENIPGNAYFITDAEGSNFFKFFDQIVIGAGYKIWPKNFWIPRGIAYAMGSMSEFFAFLARPIMKYHPKFSRFAVTYTCTDFTFSSRRAEKDFGYKPKYSEEEAMEKTIAYYRKGR